MRSGLTFYIFRGVEWVILAAFFGFVPVFLCLLATIVITSALFGTKDLGPWVLWSFVPAAVIDVFFLKKLVKSAYKINIKALGCVYLFYSIVGLGVCMGIPLVSFTLGIAAGLYAAKKMQTTLENEHNSKRYFKKTAFFNAAVMGVMCLLIAIWAIAGQMIGYRFQTPWLSFTFTVPIFFGIVLTGGAAAVTLQYLVTLFAAKLAFRFLFTQCKA